MSDSVSALELYHQVNLLDGITNPGTPEVDVAGDNITPEARNVTHCLYGYCLRSSD